MILIQDHKTFFFGGGEVNNLQKDHSIIAQKANL